MMSFQSVRTSIAAVCLWIAILQAAVTLGGNVFQMVVIDPVCVLSMNQVSNDIIRRPRSFALRCLYPRFWQPAE